MRSHYFKFHENRFSGSGADGRTDRPTYTTKIKVTFWRFAKALQNSRRVPAKIVSADLCIRVTFMWDKIDGFCWVSVIRNDLEVVGCCEHDGKLCGWRKSFNSANCTIYEGLDPNEIEEERFTVWLGEVIRLVNDNNLWRFVECFRWNSDANFSFSYCLTLQDMANVLYQNVSIPTNYIYHIYPWRSKTLATEFVQQSRGFGKPRID